MEELRIAYACPSYRRPLCRTARFCDRVRIYVDQSEAEEYRKANEGYGEVVACPDGVQGNLPRVRNYILDQEFKNADVVVMMDDDVSGLYSWRVNEANGFGYVKHKIDGGEELDAFVRMHSQLCLDWGFGQWACNYNQDKLLYKHYLPFSTTKVALGQFMVFVKDELRFDEGLPLKEDYDMALQQAARYRGNLCVNYAYVEGDFGKLSGGTAVRRNISAEREQFRRFKKKWGSDIVKGCPSCTHSGWQTKVVGGYDFSHPRITIPIKGV